MAIRPCVFYNSSMRFILTFLITISLLSSVFTLPVVAANNLFGVHLLDPSEIHSAAPIVNGNGGDWGYVTIPIRANDRDLKKWQKFMDDARTLHIIPIVRLAAVPQNSHWRLPSFDEILDFSNFLNDLVWPTQTKYIVAFNEPNHSREWGNVLDPVGYAAILDFAIDRFKSLDPDFFILPAAMDASAPNNSTSLSGGNYLQQMLKSAPQLAEKIDGLNSHSYPNPDFSGAPTQTHPKSIAGFRHELSHWRRYTDRKLPVFITETGWRMDTIPPVSVASFYNQAFTKVWTDSQVVAVTPFLLSAHEGEFQKFSLLNRDGSLTEPAKMIASLPKSAGTPALETSVSSTPSAVAFVPASLPTPAKLINLDPFVDKIHSTLRNLSGKRNLVIRGTAIDADFANSNSERAKGLSGRSALGTNSGMLFTYPKPGIYTFWMKDMQFSLDFIWIKDDRVVQLDLNIPPPASGQSPTILTPAQELDSVLEVNAGFVRIHGIEIGDIVEEK